MNLRNLQSKLEGLPAVGNTASQPLILDAALIEQRDITALFGAALATNAITIQGPSVSSDGNQIIVKGKASFLNVEAMPVEAVFTDDNGNLKFRLTAHLPAAWKFGQSFPDLPQNFNFDPENYGYSDPYLDWLTFSKPVFLLTNHAYRDTDSTVQFEKGLNFRGQLALARLLPGLEPITEITDEVLVTGLVASDNDIPEFCLGAHLPLRLGDNALAKKFQNIQLRLWNSLSSTDTGAARIELSVLLEIVEGKTVELYCPFRIGAPLDFLVIGGRFTNLDLPDLGQITALVGGEDLKKELPEALRSFGGLTITEVRTGISLTGPELAYVLLSVRTTSPWIIVEDILEIDSISATWLVQSPFLEDQRRISCEIEGRLNIADVGLDLYAQVPDFQMRAALAEGSVIKLGALLKHFIPDIALPADSLIISMLTVLVDPNTKTYQVDARVENVWSIPLGSGEINIASLSLSLTKTEARLTGHLAGVINLSLPVDKSEYRVTVFLSAALPGSEDGGWQFSGSTGQGQKIPLGALIKKLVSLCGEVELPDAVKKFTIENLAVTFNTQTRNFTFACEGKLPLLEGKPPIEAKVDILIDQQLGEKRLGGKLIIYPAEGERLEFTLKFKSDSEGQAFLARYQGNQKVSIDNLLKQAFTESITTGVELILKDALLAYIGDKVGAKYLFGLNIGIDIGLAKLPLVGPALPAELKVAINDLRILAATREFRLPEVNALNKLIEEQSAKLPSGKTDGGDTALRKGFNVSAKLTVAGAEKLLMLPAAEGDNATETSVPTESRTSPPPAQPETSEAVAKTRPPSGISKWFDIQKSLGPLRLQRLGVQFQFKDQRLGFMFDAGMDLLGVRLDLLGLSISLPLKNPKISDLEFGLEGLELAIKQKPIEIVGSLLKLTPPPPGVTFQYDGRVLVRTQVFSLAALGSYAEVNGKPSLFIFAVLHKELGGPSFFFVTGLAFGFGVNRQLRLPAISDVHNFPLIKGAIDPEYFGSEATPRAALEKLQEYVPPSVGDYWLAAGVKFNSFGMIDSFAVLTVSFGTQFQIAILGLSKITVPRQLPGAPKVDPVACAELAIKVSFTLASGILAAEARLTENSFVFSKDCKLTGGFALYCWLGPENAGDFVVTLGGYHPRFLKPSYYPLVPRLGMNWAVSDNLAIEGELYFALTPSCLMAGGKLSAVYQAGNLRAWFFAFADFLIGWKPFFYDIEMGIRIGVAYRLSALGVTRMLTLELGAWVKMWGPPFSGTAHITFYILSFDIAFGAARQPELKKVEWDEFQQSFLPQGEKKDADPLVGSIRITSGLIKEQEISRNGSKRTVKVVNAHELSFTTESVLPATSVLFNNQSIGTAAEPLGVRPMDLKTLTSVHTVTLEPTGPCKSDWASHVTPSLVTSNVPDALWSNKGLVRLDKPAAEMIKNVPNGVRVTLRNRAPNHALAPMELAKFKYDLQPKDIAWQDRQPPSVITAQPNATLANTIWSNKTVDATRDAIMIALRKSRTAVQLQRLSENASEIFQSPPEVARLGEPFKRPFYAG
jgi:hypothetical protein